MKERECLAKDTKQRRFLGGNPIVFIIFIISFTFFSFHLFNFMSDLFVSLSLNTVCSF